MEQLKNEQTEQQTHTAAAEQVTGEDGGEVSLGKFKNTAALLSAYNSLQSEFTKRCQKVKDLEAQLSAVEKDNTPTKTEEISETEKQDVLKEYLKGVLSKKQSAIVMDGAGTGFKTPISRPKTIAQAGVLAQEIFNKK
jgi:hypothetical protein